MNKNSPFPFKKLFLSSSIISFLFIATVSNAQVSSIKIKSKEWQQFFSNEFVLISYRYDECHDVQNGIHKENVYLRIVNITGQKLKAEWNSEYWYNNICNGCNVNEKENYKTLILEPNQLLEGICGGVNNELSIFSKMLNFPEVPILSNFNLRDFKVTPILN